MKYYIVLGQTNCKFKMYVLYNEKWEFQIPLSFDVELAKIKASNYAKNVDGILEVKISNKSLSGSSTKMPNGKYAGMNIYDVMSEDLNWMCYWLYTNVPKSLKPHAKIIYQILKSEGILQKCELYSGPDKVICK